MKIENFKLKIIFFGTPSFVVPIAKVITEKFILKGVVTPPDARVGRKKILTPTPVKTFALKHAIPVIELTNMENGKWQKENDKPDLFIVAAYGKLIPKKVLNIPKYGSLNIHPSLLPKYRGPSPIQTTILNGDQKTGVSIIQMDEELDHGPVVYQKEYLLKPNDTFERLHNILFQEAADILPKIIEEYINGKLIPNPQDDAIASYSHKIHRESGYFNLENPPAKDVLDRMIRAYHPWPTAWTKIRIRNQELRIKLLPGKKVQVEGGKVMSIKELINGYPNLNKIQELLEI